jgi:antitoxin (DNA-binding transcriptional repressor) of toxin-antitoxin stability system
MAPVPTSEAKTRSREFFDRVIRVEEVIIPRDDKPAARRVC